jgi:hypothetical protein
MSDFLEFVFMFALRGSLKTDRKNMEGLCLDARLFPAVYGGGLRSHSDLFLRQYIQGIVAIVASIMIRFCGIKCTEGKIRTDKRAPDVHLME